jgi:hypothetical protein
LPTQIQLNGRNYIQLLALTPGVSSMVASGFGLFSSFGVSASSQSVDGNRTDTTRPRNHFLFMAAARKFFWRKKIDTPWRSRNAVRFRP